MKISFQCLFAVVALFSGLSAQAAAETLSPLELCAQPRLKCKTIREKKVQLCTWKAGTCKPKVCNAFKMGACKKVSHCQYKPKMKKCAPKPAQIDTKCEKDLVIAEKALKVAKAEAESCAQSAKADLCGTGTVWNGSKCVVDTTNICGEGSWDGSTCIGTPCTTDQPTSTPTDQPTSTPTDQPTLAPTDQLTFAPTISTVPGHPQYRLTTDCSKLTTLGCKVCVDYYTEHTTIHEYEGSLFCEMMGGVFLNEKCYIKCGFVQCGNGTNPDGRAGWKAYNADRFLGPNPMCDTGSCINMQEASSHCASKCQGPYTGARKCAECESRLKLYKTSDRNYFNQVTLPQPAGTEPKIGEGSCDR